MSNDTTLKLEEMVFWKPNDRLEYLDKSGLYNLTGTLIKWDTGGNILLNNNLGEEEIIHFERVKENKSLTLRKQKDSHLANMDKNMKFVKEFQKAYSEMKENDNG